MRLEGKNAIVTGGASGIGRGIAECFAQEGARVAIADLNQDAAEEVIKKGEVLRESGAVAIKTDVTSDESVTAMVEESLRLLGHVDILVNNAGMAGEIGDPFPLNDSGNWMRVLDTNLVSMERTVHALWENFTGRRSGSIINIASIVAHLRGDLRMKPAYNASKAGILSLTRTLAIHLAEFNVRVNSISPGLLYTGFWQHLGDQLRRTRPEQYPEGVEIYDVFLKRVSELVPLRREQTPYDVGWAAVFLASDEARNITGVDLPVDGGVLAR